jgi:hypothetical protein
VSVGRTGISGGPITEREKDADLLVAEIVMDRIIIERGNALAAVGGGCPRHRRKISARQSSQRQKPKASCRTRTQQHRHSGNIGTACAAKSPNRASRVPMVNSCLSQRLPQCPAQSNVASLAAIAASRDRASQPRPPDPLTGHGGTRCTCTAYRLRLGLRPPAQCPHRHESASR